MKKDVISLTNKLFDEYLIQELETRLETDPLLFFGFMAEMMCSCNNITCSTVVCGCNGVWTGSCACDEIEECNTLRCGCNGEYKGE
jgi:hypothetical protein